MLPTLPNCLRSDVFIPVYYIYLCLDQEIQSCHTKINSLVNNEFVDLAKLNNRTKGELSLSVDGQATVEKTEYNQSKMKIIIIIQDRWQHYCNHLKQGYTFTLDHQLALIQLQNAYQLIKLRNHLLPYYSLLKVSMYKSTLGDKIVNHQLARSQRYTCRCR